MKMKMKMKMKGVQGKEAEITLPGRRRKLVTATGYSPTSDSGESNLGAKYKIQSEKYWCPPQKLNFNLKYGKPRLGESTLT